MPRYYCDYCDAYLTHDSMTGRQQHMRGWKHRENFKTYYAQFYPQWLMAHQSLQMQLQLQHMLTLQQFQAGLPPPPGAPPASSTQVLPPNSG
eukprot:gene7558-8160_t